jgi:hypothetical protein
MFTISKRKYDAYMGVKTATPEEITDMLITAGLYTDVISVINEYCGEHRIELLDSFGKGNCFNTIPEVGCCSGNGECGYDECDMNSSFHIDHDNTYMIISRSRSSSSSYCIAGISFCVYEHVHNWNVEQAFNMSVLQRDPQFPSKKLFKIDPLYKIYTEIYTTILDYFREHTTVV